MEVQVSCLKEDLDREQQRWRAAQTNYERQVNWSCYVEAFSSVFIFERRYYCMNLVLWDKVLALSDLGLS